jgi:hypothetical protein
MARLRMHLCAAWRIRDERALARRRQRSVPRTRGPKLVTTMPSSDDYCLRSNDGGLQLVTDLRVQPLKNLQRITLRLTLRPPRGIAQR